MEKIKKRIASLRDAMSRAGVVACIIPGTDPHASEYIADCWKDREWISGFSGSAGTVVVTQKKAALWTDSRYFLQATVQLSGTGVELVKLGVPNEPDIISWIKANLNSGDKVCINPLMCSVNSWISMKNSLARATISLVNADLLHEVWTDRPMVPSHPCFPLDVSYAGQSVAQKLDHVRKQMLTHNADLLVLSMLDEIAWLFNIRGRDVLYNPVVISYALIGQEDATLFVDPDKIDSETRTLLDNEGVKVSSYHMIFDTLKTLPAKSRILFDGSRINQSLFDAFPSDALPVNAPSPVSRLKCIKNETELNGFRKAMVKDGIALTRFFKWLEENVHSGELTEMSVDLKLNSLRMQQAGAVGPSFGSISSYGSHGAIVHYSATPETDVTLYPEGIYLLDSGGQYFEGTTDITRTISLGNPTKQQCIDFSLVLKGNIALNSIVFPLNTRGSQLDVLARMNMWKQGINYGHGTGHGIGHFLNVHEGPQSIRPEENPVALEAGMVLSNEPGIYREGEYGIRIENLMCILPAMTTPFATFLKFETLTLCYIDQQLMDFTILDADDVAWIDAYHRMVLDRLSPGLTEEERIWLAEKCKPCQVVM